MTTIISVLAILAAVAVAWWISRREHRRQRRALEEARGLWLAEREIRSNGHPHTGNVEHLGTIRRG